MVGATGEMPLDSLDENKKKRQHPDDEESEEQLGLFYKDWDGKRAKGGW